MHTSLKLDPLHLKAMDVVKRYKSCEIELIEILQQVESRKVFYSLGYNSMFKYATDALGLSPEVAYIFINVARKAKEVPALKEEIKNGSITLSKAKKITSVLTHNNQKHWLGLAKTTSKRELEKQVAFVNPKESVREQMSYVHPTLELKEDVKILKNPTPRVQLQVGVSEALMLKLRRVQDLVSQKNKKAMSLEDTLEALVNSYIERNDPLKKAERQKMRGKLQKSFTNQVSNQKDPLGQSVSSREAIKKSQQVPGLVGQDQISLRKEAPVKSTIPSRTFDKFKKTKRHSIPAHIRHQVYLKYQSQCAHIDPNGQRCFERRHLQIHHIKLVSMGGGDEFENLTLLCYGHHQGLHHNLNEGQSKKPIYSWPKG